MAVNKNSSDYWHVVGLYVHPTALSTFDFYKQWINIEVEWELWTYTYPLKELDCVTVHRCLVSHWYGKASIYAKNMLQKVHKQLQINKNSS